MINECYRALFELRHDSESMYQYSLRFIENFNVITSTYQNEEPMGNL